MNSVITNIESVEHLHESNHAIETAMQEVYEEVALNHKRLGQPLVTWQNGKVVLVPPDEIVIEDDNARK